jgi:DNA repair protein RadA/Sms
LGKSATIYSCIECGNQATKWLGRCPECNAWNSYAAEEKTAPGSRPASLSSSVEPLPINAVGADRSPRLSTSLPNFDRALGGGIVSGAVILVGGEPGIGKSTLLLQIAEHLAWHGPVLYVSGEESPHQLALRAERLGTTSENIRIFTETSVERIIAAAEKLKPVALIVDSVQTVHTSLNDSTPGSIAQVRDSAGTLMTAAKRLSLPVFLIGHITKEGTIAGPKSLEHIVDTVLYFEGDKFQNYRVVRACKNRFGPVNELAIFEMFEDGLHEVGNPSAALISQRGHNAGSAVLAAVEGTRPLLIEVQALVSPAHFGSPRRMAMGVDSNRLSLLLAVLERRSGEKFAAHDVFVNVAGGLQIDEPALDLAIVGAVLSSQRNVPIPHDVVVFGEVGLLGEIRSVSQADLRAREAAALGFRRVLVPHTNAAEIRADVEVVAIRGMDQFAQALFTSSAATL